MAAREQAQVLQARQQPEVLRGPPDERSGPAAMPDVKRQPELAQARVPAVELLPERVPVVGLRQVGPRPRLAVVAQMSGRRPSAARLFP